MKEIRLIIKLLEDLDTNSPKKREECIQEYFKDTTLPFDPDQVSQIINKYTDRRIAKTEIGKISYNLKKDQIKTNDYVGPGFREKGFKCTCTTCGKEIGSGSPRFFEKVDDKWATYHGVDDTCVPLKEKEAVNKNPFYTRWRLRMSQIKNIKKDLNAN